ncbi:MULTISPECIES: DUF6299 family protein [unclassified Streptomyces]|uniref:DUF6299 family protein n=1 Tax=unclassified Streptomyces TaxID=2593676 RepID=UPI001BE85585|nr:MULTISPECIES: DUF6299 family protein [unclassified Streptomyces]MBT2406391.1 hypothetical protein [Streptomyces sp. ISL-21]MBT2454140.1 hypothetical protein [Streptomyces sp. ISL-86]MBT2607513.1 hypothetical protein [Streptomyces sp. ISL-87]
MSGPRMALAALAALSALTVAAVFTTPATAASMDNGISVQPYAHIGEDGKVTLSGTYHCDDSSPVGAVQIATSVSQGDTRLGASNGEVVCDGAEHEWRTTASLALAPEIHPGRALAEVRLQEIRRTGGGLLSLPVKTVAEDVQEIELIDHR